MGLTELEQGTWGADEFVAVANRTIPEVLPDDSGTELNLRLVRHYAGLGMLDEPSKSGKEARYTYRHLLQLLLVRRMLANGFGSAAIADFPRKQANPRLAQLLTGQLELTVQSNPALDFLEGLREKAARPAPGPRVTSRWMRLEPLPGLEVQVSDSFRCPAGSALEGALDSIRSFLKSQTK